MAVPDGITVLISAALLPTTCGEEGITVALQVYTPLLTVRSKLAIVALLWKTPLVTEDVGEMVTVEELLSCPLGPNHVVATLSALFTLGGRVTMQRRVTILSLINRWVLTDISTLGGGTKHKEGKEK